MDLKTLERTSESPAPNGATAKTRYHPWAELLKRTFAVEVERAVVTAVSSRSVATLNAPESFVQRSLKAFVVASNE